MMSTNDPMDRLLHEDAARSLRDDGFTSRVMASLPAKRGARATWWKPALIVGSTMLGSVLAMAFAPAGTSLVQGFIDITHSRVLTSAALTGLATCAALLICALVLAADVD
jgi:hypothetical protein